jgi:cation-transporting P-type ATPase E
MTTVDAATDRPPVDPRRGLTAAEVAERVARGEVNAAPPAPSRTVGEILRANLFTRFNALMTSLGAVVLAAGAPADALFLGVVVANTLIGVLQELRAKRTLDKLALLNAPRARVIRNGAVEELAVDDLVLDDVLDLTPGQQVVADAVALTSDSLELDESLLTGEADAVDKAPGHELLSGSFVVAGAGRAQVVRVGADAYAAKLASEARRFSLTKSELMRNVNRIVQVVTWLLVPIGTLLAVTQFVIRDESWQDAAVSAVAGVVGMVPEGLILLTSVAFAVGAVRLAQRRALVNELAAVEVLARVDVLCVDKTGTITAGTLDLAEVRPLDRRRRRGRGAGGRGGQRPEPQPHLRRPSSSPTRRRPAGWTLVRAVPFSSARKWSAAVFEGRGTYVLGAPEFVLGDRYEEIRAVVEPEADAGRRVLLLAHAPDPLDGEHLPPGITATALVLLEDRLRHDAADTFTYFARQGVTIKVISGDNAEPCRQRGPPGGIDGAERAVDARELPDARPSPRPSPTRWTPMWCSAA